MKPILLHNELPEKAIIPINNRTGAATAVSNVAVLDTIQANAASTTIALGMNNAVAPATANLASKAVVVETVIPNNNEGLAVFAGPVLARVNGTIARGNRLKLADGQPHFVIASGAGLHWTQAEALQANASGAGVIMVRLFREPIPLTNP